MLSTVWYVRHVWIGNPSSASRHAFLVLANSINIPFLIGSVIHAPTLRPNTPGIWNFRAYFDDSGLVIMGMHPIADPRYVREERVHPIADPRYVRECIPLLILGT
jgi:hypothetical protein